MADARDGSSSVVLSVFFEGTANRLRPPTTQVGLFFEQCDALDVTDLMPDNTDGVHNFKMGFDGCGVVSGLAGTIWAFGLSDQCKRAVSRVQDLLQHKGAPHRLLIINALGLSRGGIAALMLAQALSKVEGDLLSRVSLNLCLFDPVPGNLITTSKMLDPFGMTMANIAVDVSHCGAFLRRCLAIYPYEALPDLAFHAPVLPNLPPSCVLEEDATLGCHQGAFYAPGRVRPGGNLYASCLLSYLRVSSFLSRCGTPLPPPSMEAARMWEASSGCSPAASCDLRDACLQLMDAALHSALGTKPARRIAHTKQSRPPGAIIRNAAGQYLNRHHLALVAERAAENAASGGAGGGGKALASEWEDAPSEVAPCASFDSSQPPLLLLEVQRSPLSTESGGEDITTRNLAAEMADFALVREAAAWRGTEARAPPACVASCPRVLYMTGLPLHLSGWNGEFVLAMPNESPLRNGRPVWRRRPQSGLFMGVIGASVWFDGTRWVMQRDGEPDEGPYVLQSVLQSLPTPQGAWAEGDPGESALFADVDVNGSPIKAALGNMSM